MTSRLRVSASRNTHTYQYGTLSKSVVRTSACGLVFDGSWCATSPALTRVERTCCHVVVCRTGGATAVCADGDELPHAALVSKQSIPGTASHLTPTNLRDAPVRATRASGGPPLLNDDDDHWRDVSRHLALEDQQVAIAGSLEVGVEIAGDEFPALIASPLERRIEVAGAELVTTHHARKHLCLVLPSRTRGARSRRRPNRGRPRLRATASAHRRGPFRTRERRRKPATRLLGCFAALAPGPCR